MRLTVRLAAFALSLPLAHGAGLLIPQDPEVPPLALRTHRVQVELDGHRAVTRIEQVFENNTERALEARFVFPLPRGALLQSFAIGPEGREVAARCVERDQAQALYQSMIRRSGNPSLIEYVGRDLLAVTIFPVPAQGTQRIAFSYAQLIEPYQGVYGYTYPLRTGAHRGAKVSGDVSIEVKLRAGVPIKSVYSPSFAIDLARPAETEAVARYAGRGVRLDKDFQLFYATSEQGVGMSLITHRPDPAKPGYFLLALAPKVALQAGEVVQRDVVLVADTSYSMEQDGKMEQARAALRHGIRQLGEGDRFNLVTFSTEVDAWRSSLVPADEANKRAALAYVDALEASGGTNIDGALAKALSFVSAGSTRPYTVVFMTDGKPTLGGTTEPAKIAQRLAGRPAGDPPVRVFTWGVGFDVDAPLLDKLAQLGSGTSEYVRPEEDIATKLGAFFGRTSRPALAGLSLAVIGGEVQLVQPYPRVLPDLFAGSQVLLVGRYQGAGATALALEGQVNGRAQRFVYEGEFPASEPRHAFLEGLWVQRRIGHLLDAIRLEGESPELKDEVIALSRQFGIQTPYTSFLAGDDPLLTQLGARGASDRREAAQQLADEAAKAAGAARPAGAPAADAAAERGRELRDGFGRKDGHAALAVAAYLQRLKGAEGEASLPAFRRAGGVRYLPVGELLVDERYTAECEVVRLRFGGAGYFALLERRPDLGPALQLGEALLVVARPGLAVLISAAGEESLTDAQLSRLAR